MTNRDEPRPQERSLQRLLQEKELERANERIKELESRLEIANRAIESMGQRRIDDPDSPEKEFEDLKEAFRQLRDLENRNENLRLDNQHLDRMLKDMTEERDQAVKLLNRPNEPSKELRVRPALDRGFEFEP